MNKKLTALIIMDGFGVPQDESRSGITKENTKNLQELAKKYSHTNIFASEEYVGLPKGQAGTSEVGHMTIGSGRITYQPIVKINKEIESGAFFENRVLLDAFDYAKKNNKSIHLLGIVSDGGVHSHINHLFALLEMCKQNNVKDVFVHIISDGRDTPPKSVKTFIEQVEAKIKEIGCGKIATLVGRFYALDRDKNYDRNAVAYKMWTQGEGKKFENIYEGVESSYNNGESDEFIKPIILTHNAKPVATINKGDVVISYNFRADRERQLAYVMAEQNDLDFVLPLDLYFVTMTEYDEHFTKVKVVYKNQTPTNILSQVLSENGVKQLKVAETEKYAHLTFFFNSGKQDCYENEDRIIINSTKMASYASFPEMSAQKITDKVLSLIDNYDFVAINFANTDMVGHSGVKSAARIATNVVDNCVKQVVDAILKRGGQGIVTADHGNADIMEYEDGTPHTAHTTSIVPLIIFGDNFEQKSLKENGSLADIAPTLLKMMNLPIPSDMTGTPLY